MPIADAQDRPRRLQPLALLAALTLLVYALFAGGGGVVAPERAAAQACGLPGGLSPNGPGPTRFTMLLRINTQANVDAYTNFNSATGGLGGRVRPQDIFVINTRFLGNASGTEPPVDQSVAKQLADNLKARFPCNRIVALNGLSFNPSAPGFALTLYDHPGVFALMSDFEPIDWNQGRATVPGRTPWRGKYKVALKRIKKWLGFTSGTLANYPTGVGKRVGLVPVYHGKWDYGRIAQAINKKNRRLGGRKLGLQSVQTQDSCADGGASGFAARTKQIHGQYRFKVIRKKVKRGGKVRKIKIRRKIKKKGRPNLNSLAVQISFSHNPTGSGMAITKTSAALADACLRKGLKKGAGAFFFFASTEAMSQLFLQPRMAALRPATS